MGYKDGSSYMGQVLNGERHGHGVWESKGSADQRSNRYDGQWCQDYQHGKGLQNWSDGRVYDGEFAYGKLSGFGRMTWDTGSGLMRYEGEDQKHGEGRFVWPDGCAYEGQWVAGKRHGRGAD